MKVRFNAAQLALIRRAKPGCNLDNLSEVTFELDDDGNVVHCNGRVEDPSKDQSYAGTGLAMLYVMAMRQREQQLQGASAAIIPFRGVANA